MAMLAERKRKQKWSLNPRGNDWAQDSSKFGQKLLEKMGWTHGKGLGARMDGITEHIKVSYKNDVSGVGFKDSNDQWTEHESNFSSLLESLNPNSGLDILSTPVQSLEKKSQSSKVRVHYHKFTRGKDLSRYSARDLAQILGKKSTKSEPEQPIKEPELPNNDLLVNSGSMADYFKRKTQVLSKKRKFEDDCENSDLDGPEKSKKNKKKHGIDNPNLTVIDNVVAPPEDNPYEVKVKTKKKKTKKEGIDNPNLSLYDCEPAIEENPYEVKPKVKKSKKQGLDNPNLTLETTALEQEQEPNPFEVKLKKKKKRKAVVEEGIDNPNLMLNDSITKSATDEVENPYEVKKKKKKKKSVDVNVEIHSGIDNPNLSLNDGEESIVTNETMDNVYEVKVKKNKKNKRKDTEKPSTPVQETQIVEIPPMPECDLMLNVVTTPILRTPASKPVSRSKSVRFSDRNEERIIPNNLDLRMMAERQELDKINDSVLTTGVLESDLAKKLDGFQAEIENDINEAKSVKLTDIMVGDVQSNLKEHQKTPDGTKLKFGGVKFGKNLPYFENAVGPKKAYKHLIKGDLLLAFKNTNLHVIHGYAVTK